MDTTTEPRVFERMSALGDLARSRVLVLLEQGELTVSELVQIVQLPQSTVSRHLKVLADDGWVTSRASGTSRHYRMSPSLDREAQELWSLVRLDVVSAGHTEGDAERAIAVMAHRRQKSKAFFASAAARWDSLRDDLFGAGTDALPLIGLLDRRWTVGDLGTGTGQFAAHVAPFVGRVVAVDGSPEMRKAARARLQTFPNAEVRAGELESLPVADGELDVAVLLLVLHYIVDPPRALAEAARTLAPGGRLITVDMRPHTREGYREEVGHVWSGFDERSMSLWHRQAGLTDFQCQPLPARPEATGPLLFVASATRPD
jgi:ArsR family transcriptional regulator